MTHNSTNDACFMEISGIDGSKERRDYMNKLIAMTIAFVAMLVINGLATTGVLNNQTTSEISNSQTVLITPAGYVFSIWGVIYVLVAIWLFLQFKRKHEEPVTQPIAMLFIASCVLNIFWLVTFHYELFAIAQIIMLGLLIALILLYKQYSVDDDRFAGRLPFSVYLGWISVATIVNMSFTLKYYDVSLGISEPIGTVVLLVVAVLLAIAGHYISKDPYFAIVFVWAIIGIATANSDTLVVYSAYIAAAVIFIVIIAVSLLFNKQTA